jgi:hypothetical protein
MCCPGAIDARRAATIRCTQVVEGAERKVARTAVREAASVVDDGAVHTPVDRIDLAGVPGVALSSLYLKIQSVDDAYRRRNSARRETSREASSAVAVHGPEIPVPPQPWQGL